MLSASALAAVSLPDKPPGIIAQIAQKDKAGIVLINSIVTGKAVMPSYTMVQGGGGSGSIVGTWQSSIETVTFTAGGQFSGSSAQTGAFGGTYMTQGNNLLLTYVPSQITAQFTFTVSGNTLTLYSPQIGSSSYTRVGGSTTTAGSDVVANAQNLMLVKESGTGAKLLTEEIMNGASGTGFVISPDGYIVTNAHVVLAHKDPEQMLVDSLANSFANQLYAEASQYYNIPQQDKEKVVQILLEKFMTYFTQNGQMTDVTVNYYVLNGVASPGEDLKVKSWPAVVKKQGTVYEKIGGEVTWGRDVAILKVEKSNLPTVTLGDSSKVQVGDSIFVIGYPGKAADPIFKPESILEPTVSRGVISAKKQLRTGVESLQTDASVLPGNSGGPAYNENGEVIGIATFGATEGAGVNFLMPINLAKEFMNELNVQNKHSIIDTKYADALNAFWNRDCSKTITKMKEVLSLYPGHPYAQDYILECERAIQSGEVSKPLDTGMIGAVVIICIVGAFFLIKKRRIRDRK
jgi:S1-C subfamily serine protease